MEVVFLQKTTSRKKTPSQRLVMLTMGLFTLSAAMVTGAEEVSVKLWCELEPMVFDEQEYPRSPESAARLLLEEAKVYLSAMVYGFRFVYTPLDKARKVQEVFTLEPIAEIDWGDPNLKIIYTQVKDNRLYGKLAYVLKDYQNQRRQAWRSNTLESASGRGEESLLEGQPAKIGAFQKAIKEAIRAYARERIYSKPREITGEILLWTTPRTIIDAGAYWTTVKIKVFLENHRPYNLY